MIVARAQEKKITHFPSVHFSVTDVLWLSGTHFYRKLFRNLVVLIGMALGFAFLSSLLFESLLFSEKMSGLRVPEYLWWTSAITLIITFMGVINSLIISIRERTSEIGVLVTLGAQNKYIMLYFYVEILFFGFVGSLAGFFIGFLFSIIVALSRVDILFIAQTLANLENIVLVTEVLVFIVILGVLFSSISYIYPAIKVLRKNPTENLRFEV